MVTKLKDWKIAKRYKADSEHFLKVLDLSARGLAPFKTYIPIKRILAEIHDQTALLKAHLTTAEKILSKEKNDET